MKYVVAVALATASLLTACAGEEAANPRDNPAPHVEEAPENGDLLFARGDYTLPYDEEWRVFAARRGGGAVERVSPLGFAAVPLPSPNGRWLAFSKPTRVDTPPRQVHVVPLRGRTPRRLTLGRWADWPAEWSPDGRRLLVGHSAGIGHQNISVVDVFGETRRLIRVNGSAVEGATWSPDGRRLIASGGSLGPFGLYSIDTRTWAAERLQLEEGYSALFAPDGGLTLLTTRSRPARHELWLADEDGSNRELVLSTRGSFWQIAWSPDASRLAVVVLFGDDDTARLVVVSSTARNERVTEASGVPGRHAVWSPDGSKLAFARGRFPADDVWMMTADGAIQRRLTQTRASERPLAWPPTEPS